MKIWVFAIIAFALITASLGAALYSADSENGELRDIYNFTESGLTYGGDYSYSDLDRNISNVNLPEIKYVRLTRVVDSFVNFVLVTSFEATKFFVEFGYENPDIDYRKFMKILVVILLLSFWTALIPVIAIIAIIIKGIIWLVKKLRRCEFCGDKLDSENNRLCRKCIRDANTK